MPARYGDTAVRAANPEELWALLTREDFKVGRVDFLDRVGPETVLGKELFADAHAALRRLHEFVERNDLACHLFFFFFFFLLFKERN